MKVMWEIQTIVQMSDYFLNIMVLRYNLQMTKFYSLTNGLVENFTQSTVYASTNIQFYHQFPCESTMS